LPAQRKGTAGTDTEEFSREHSRSVHLEKPAALDFNTSAPESIFKFDVETRADAEVAVIGIMRVLWGERVSALVADDAIDDLFFILSNALESALGTFRENKAMMENFSLYATLKGDTNSNDALQGGRHGEAKIVDKIDVAIAKGSANGTKLAAVSKDECIAYGGAQGDKKAVLKRRLCLML